MERNITFLKKKIFQRTFDQMIIKFTKRNSTGINSQTNSKREGILPLRYEGILWSYKKFSHCGQGVRIDISQFKTEKNIPQTQGQFKVFLTSHSKRNSRCKRELNVKLCLWKSGEKEGEKYMPLGPRDFGGIKAEENINKKNWCMWPQMVANIPTLKNKNPEQNKEASAKYVLICLTEKELFDQLQMVLSMKTSAQPQWYSNKHN